MRQLQNAFHSTRSKEALLLSDRQQRVGDVPDHGPVVARQASIGSQRRADIPTQAGGARADDAQSDHDEEEPDFVVAHQEHFQGVQRDL